LKGKKGEGRYDAALRKLMRITMSDTANQEHFDAALRAVDKARATLERN
jgi:hypothetical protein